MEEFAGKGIIDGEINDDIADIVNCNVNETMPENNSLCLLSDGKYLLDGIINASGRFTADGVASFTQKLIQSTLIGSEYFLLTPLIVAWKIMEQSMLLVHSLEWVYSAV